MSNLEEYVSLIVDASLNSGISRQIGAFKSGFDQVCVNQTIFKYNLFLL